MPNIVKNTTFPNPLDLLAPHSCRGCGHIGKVLCDRCKNNIILGHNNYCPNCHIIITANKCNRCKSLPLTFVAGNRSELIYQLAYDFKYNSIRSLAEPLAEILNEILPIIDEPVDVVPLPTIDRHIRERGLDHTYLIAKYLCKLRNWQVNRVLSRAKNNVQVGSNRQTRLTQATSNYILASKKKINPSITYILLDDIWTTGASMKSAIKKLQQAGVQKIIVAILATSHVNQN